MSLHRNIRGQGRVPGTVSGLRDEMPGVVIPVQEKKNFYFQDLEPTQPPFQWVPAILLGVKVDKS